MDDIRAGLELFNTELRYFPKSTTHSVQPADYFTIQKLKHAWTRRLEEGKMLLVKTGLWTDSSGKIRNPGKTYFMKLAVAAVRDVNYQRDGNGITYGRKAMIRTGIALNINGLWEEGQFSPKLQEIINRHRDYFDGRAFYAPKFGRMLFSVGYFSSMIATIMCAMIF